MPRYIRLKEHGPNQDRWVTPTDEYLAGTFGNLQKKPYRCRTDEHGFICTGRDLPRDDRPLIVLGDSVIENYWVDEDKRICSVLEGLLTNVGVRVRVLNGGVTGATTLHLLSVLVNKCIPLQPSMVLLMSGAIDCIASVHGGYWCSHEHITPITEPPNLPNRDLADRLKLLRLFKETCRIFAIDFFAVTCPTYLALEDEKTASSEPEPLRVANKITRTYGGPCIDLEAELSGRPELFYDSLHPSEVGCQVMAERLFEVIKPSLLCQRWLDGVDGP